MVILTAARSPYRWRASGLCMVGWHRRANFACLLDMEESHEGNSQEVQHLLAGGKSTNLLPFPLPQKPAKAKIKLSMFGARGKPSPS